MEALLQNAVDAISLGSLYAVLAIGIALIFGIMNLLNFAYGELITIGGYTVVVLSGSALGTRLVGVVVIVIVAAVLMERIAFRPFRRASASVLLVTSFAVSFALQSLMTVAFSSRARGVSLSPWFNRGFEVGSVRMSNLNVLTVLVSLSLVTSLAVFLKRSRTGLEMRAAAENFNMARLVGVRSNRVVVAAFALSGGFAAVAAVLLLAQTGTVTPQMGTTPVLIAFVATIVGGMGSVYGAAFGGFVLGILTVALQVALPLSAVPYRDAVLYACVLGILLLRPQGLVAVRARLERV